MTTEKNRKKRAKLKKRKIDNLSGADITGWRQHTPYHFRKCFGDVWVDWWPSTRKCMIKNEVYRYIDGNDIQNIVDAVASIPKQVAEAESCRK